MTGGLLVLMGLASCMNGNESGSVLLYSIAVICFGMGHTGDNATIDQTLKTLERDLRRGRS
jgi:hypothetical protein